MHVYDGNKNRRTKAELKVIAESEIKLGGKKFEASEMIKADPVALKKWDSLIKTYQDYDIDFISDSDSGAIEQYCMSYSTNVKLEKVKRDAIKKLEKEGETELTIMSMINDIQKAIDTQVKIMLPLSDRLFLNPVSKIKGMRKQKEPQKQKPNKFNTAFGEI